MNKLLGDTSALANMTNPFKLSCIEKININYYRNFFNLPKFIGSIGFVNGNTKGEQRFEGKSLVDVLMQIKTFCDSLEDNSEEVKE